MKRSDFPSEDNLPKDRHELYDLLVLARQSDLSYRYIQVIRHRMLDATMELINEGRL